MFMMMLRNLKKVEQALELLRKRRKSDMTANVPNELASETSSDTASIANPAASVSAFSVAKTVSTGAGTEVASTCRDLALALRVETARRGVAWQCTWRT